MNINAIMSAVILVVGILSGIFVVKHILHMFQQNRYEQKRYLAWLWQQPKRKYYYIIASFVSVAYWMLIFNFLEERSLLQTILILASSVIIFFWDFLKERRQIYIKPLIYTARVKRQTVVFYVLSAIIMLLIYLFLPFHLWFLYFVGLRALPWISIVLVHWLTLPIEWGIKRYYLGQAKGILKKYPKLIKIGITGSYGKTSSKNILQNILSEQYYTLMTPASFNTPMGITITIRTLLKPIHEVFIAEMGADKVGEINYLTKFVKPKYGVVTSVGPQHLNTFKSIKNIITEKMKMIENLPIDGVGFVNLDNEYIRAYNIRNTCKIVTFGIKEEDVDYRAVEIEYGPYGSTFKLVTREKEVYEFQTRLLGEHNVMNILSAIAVSREMGIPWKQLQYAVRNVNFIEHRLELKRINGFSFIDNGFNSNPAGAKMSLDVLERMPGKRYVITPGMIDLGEQQQAANFEFGKYMLGKVDWVLLIGAIQSGEIRKGLEEAGFNMKRVITFKTVMEAFTYVYQNASVEDTILIENDLPDAFSR